MPNDFEPNFLPGILKTTLSVSLGAAAKTFEMMSNPVESVPRVMDEAKALLTIPEDSRKDLPDMLRGMAGIWVQKGVTIVSDCKTAGEKFTDGK